MQDFVNAQGPELLLHCLTSTEDASQQKDALGVLLAVCRSDGCDSAVLAALEGCGTVECALNLFADATRADSVRQSAIAVLALVCRSSEGSRQAFQAADVSLHETQCGDMSYSTNTVRLCVIMHMQHYITTQMCLSFEGCNSPCTL